MPKVKLHGIFNTKTHKVESEYKTRFEAVNAIKNLPEHYKIVFLVNGKIFDSEQSYLGR